MFGPDKFYRIGAWAARAAFVVTVLYILTGVVWWFSERDQVLLQSLTPGDPYLAILESLLVLWCPLMVVAMASVLKPSPRAKRLATVSRRSAS